MKRRKDIEKLVLQEGMGKHRLYEFDGMLYEPVTDNIWTKKFSFYSGIGDTQMVGILEKFNIKRTTEIVCICGLRNSFSAHYESYSLILTCKCGNSFTGYSG